MKHKFPLSSLMIVICAIVLGFGLSWAVIVGIIELITICFGGAIPLRYATGIWLILCLVYLIVCECRKGKKE